MVSGGATECCSSFLCCLGLVYSVTSMYRMNILFCNMIDQLAVLATQSSMLAYKNPVENCYRAHFDNYSLFK